MKKRVGAIEEFTVENLTEGNSLNCTLVVSGWIDSDTVGIGEYFKKNVLLKIVCVIESRTSICTPMETFETHKGAIYTQVGKGDTTRIILA